MTVYVLLSIAAGALVALTTSMNAALGKRISVEGSTLVNYAAGLVTSLVLSLFLRALTVPNLSGLPAYVYLGGALGVCVVLLNCVVLPRVPVVLVTMLLFTGQVLMGMVVDALCGIPLTAGKVFGALLIVAGLLFNVWVDSGEKKGASQG